MVRSVSYPFQSEPGPSVCIYRTHTSHSAVSVSALRTHSFTSHGKLTHAQYPSGMETRRRTAEIWRHARAPPRPAPAPRPEETCNVKQAKGVQGEGPVSYFSYTRTRTLRILRVTAFQALSSPDNSEAGLRLRISFLFWLTIAQTTEIRDGNPPPVRMSWRLLVVSYRAPRSR